MPPFWSKEGFYSAVKKAKQIDFEKLCLAHYGCFQGESAEIFLEESVKTYERWWDIFVDSDNKGKLDDVAYLKERLLKEIGTELPDLEVSKASMRMMLSLINLFKKAFGKPQISVAEVQLEGIINWLIKGYKGVTQKA